MSTENNEPLSLAESFAATTKFAPKKKRLFFTIIEGDNTYLPLPPFGRLATKGQWIAKNATHWGLSVNGVPRPFVCPGYGCAKCAFDKSVKDAYSKLVDPQSKKLLNESDKELHDLFKGYLDVHQLQITYDMNVLSQENKIGLLKIRSKMFQSLMVEEEKIKKYGVKFASTQNGTWINFHKKGKGSSALFNATAVREDKMVDGESVQVLRKTTITPDVLNRMQEEAFDLDRISTILTHEQVKQIVSGFQDYEVDQDIVDQVFKSAVAQLTSSSSGHQAGESKTAAPANPVNKADPLSKYY